MHRTIRCGRTWRPLQGALLVLLLAAVSAACGGRRVSRIDPASVTDLSGRWNDTDSRLVANALVQQSLGSTWLDEYEERTSEERPTVIVG